MRLRAGEGFSWGSATRLWLLECVFFRFISVAHAERDLHVKHKMEKSLSGERSIIDRPPARQPATSASLVLAHAARLLACFLFTPPAPLPEGSAVSLDKSVKGEDRPEWR
jgi:hypothetical protein